MTFWVDDFPFLKVGYVSSPKGIPIPWILLDLMGYDGNRIHPRFLSQAGLW